MIFNISWRTLAQEQSRLFSSPPNLSPQTPNFPPASLRSELNHLHASAIEHLRQSHQQESAAAKQELEHALEHSRIQVTRTALPL